MVADFNIKRRDNLPILRSTFYSDKELSTPVDLTNATNVLAKVGTVNSSLTINKSCTILEPRTQGRVEVQFTSEETNIPPNTYDLEFEVQWVNGDISTYPKVGHLKLTVHPDLDPVT